MRLFTVMLDMTDSGYYWSVKPAEGDVAAGTMIKDGESGLLQAAMTDAAQAMVWMLLRRSFDVYTGWEVQPVLSDPAEFDIGDLGKDDED